MYIIGEISEGQIVRPMTSGISPALTRLLKMEKLQARINLEKWGQLFTRECFEGGRFRSLLYRVNQFLKVTGLL